LKFVDKILNLFKSKSSRSYGRFGRGFAMAKVDRLTADWKSTLTALNNDIRTGLVTCRARARQLVADDPYARKFTRMVSANVVGSEGFKFRSKAVDFVKDKEGNTKKVLDNMANNMIQDAMKEWQKKKYCTVTENISFNEMCRLLVATVPVDGEVFAKKIKKPSQNKFGYALQIIESDYCDVNLNKILDNGNYIQMGIEFTPARKPVAYYFTKVKAGGDMYYFPSTSKEYERISADRIIHLFKRESFSQVRGITWFLPVAIRLKMLLGFEESSLINARLAAMTSDVLTQNEDASQDSIAGERDGDNNIIQDREPGETFIVPYGYTYENVDPKYPSDQHKAFRDTILQGVASGFDVNYNRLANDYAAINFSAYKGGQYDEQDSWKAIQAWFIEHFLEDITPEWLDMALLTDAVKLPIEKYDKFNNSKWTGRRWKGLEPFKEINAHVKANENYIETLQEILDEKGVDLHEHLDQLEYEKKEIERRGLTKGNTETDDSLGDVEQDDPDGEGLEDDQSKILKIAKQIKVM